MDTLYQSYVYKVVDLTSGEFYIGFRKGNIKVRRTPEQDLLIKYFTSGALRKRILMDPNNFRGYILFRSGDHEVSYWYEQVLIKENKSNPLCVNRTYIDPDTDRKIFWGSNNSYFLGKTFEEMYGSEKAIVLKSQLSKLLTDRLVGKTYDEIYGVELSRKLRDEKSKLMSSSDNFRVGKTYEDLYGEERAAVLKANASSRFKGQDRSSWVNYKSVDIKAEDPEGREYLVRGNIRGFCKEHGLGISSVIRSYKNKTPHYTGWSFLLLGKTHERLDAKC